MIRRGLVDRRTTDFEIPRKCADANRQSEFALSTGFSLAIVIEPDTYYILYPACKEKFPHAYEARHSFMTKTLG